MIPLSRYLLEPALRRNHHNASYDGVAGSFDSMRHTGLELFPQFVVVDVAADQHQLILAITGPVGVVDRKAFARQMEHMAAFAFVEPEDSLGPEHLLGHLVVEEVLELA